MIHTEGLTRHFGQEGDGPRRGRPRPGRGRGRAGRAARPERRRQVHDPADAHHAARADLGHGAGRRPRRGHRPGRGAAQHRLHRAGQRRRRTTSAAATSWSPRAARTAVAAPTRAPRRRADRVPRPAAVADRRSRRCRAASGAASTSRWASSTRPGCCSSTSRRPGSTRRTGPTWGSTSAPCASGTAPPSCSPRTTSTRPTRWPSGSSSIDHGRVIADDTPGAAQGRARRRPGQLGFGTPVGAACGGRRDRRSPHATSRRRRASVRARAPTAGPAAVGCCAPSTPAGVKVLSARSPGRPSTTSSSA